MKEATLEVAFFISFLAERSEPPAGLAWGIRKPSPCRARRARGTWANRPFAVAAGDGAARRGRALYLHIHPCN